LVFGLDDEVLGFKRISSAFFGAAVEPLILWMSGEAPKFQHLIFPHWEFTSCQELGASLISFSPLPSAASVTFSTVPILARAVLRDDGGVRLYLRFSSLILFFILFLVCEAAELAPPCCCESLFPL